MSKSLNDELIDLGKERSLDVLRDTPLFFLRVLQEPGKAVEIPASIKSVPTLVASEMLDVLCRSLHGPSGNAFADDVCVKHFVRYLTDRWGFGEAFLIEALAKRRTRSPLVETVDAVRKWSNSYSRDFKHDESFLRDRIAIAHKEALAAMGEFSAKRECQGLGQVVLGLAGAATVSLKTEGYYYNIIALADKKRLTIKTISHQEGTVVLEEKNSDLNHLSDWQFSRRNSADVKTHVFSIAAKVIKLDLTGKAKLKKSSLHLQKPEEPNQDWAVFKHPVKDEYAILNVGLDSLLSCSDEEPFSQFFGEEPEIWNWILTKSPTV